MIALKNIPALADRLIYIRRIKGLTQADLAVMAGTSQQAIQQAEAGIARNPRYLPKLAKALGVPVEWLTLNELRAVPPDKEWGLSEKEDQILSVYKGMGRKDQELILELMKNRQKKKS